MNRDTVSRYPETLKPAVSSLDAVLQNELSKSEQAGWERFASRGNAKSGDYEGFDNQTARLGARQSGFRYPDSFPDIVSGQPNETTAATSSRAPWKSRNQRAKSNLAQ